MYTFHDGQNIPSVDFLTVSNIDSAAKCLSICDGYVNCLSIMWHEGTTCYINDGNIETGGSFDGYTYNDRKFY